MAADVFSLPLHRVILLFTCSSRSSTEHQNLARLSVRHIETGIHGCNKLLDMVAHWLRRLLSTGGSWVRLPLKPPCRDLGQVLYLQLPVRFGVKLRYSIRAVVGSASE